MDCKKLENELNRRFDLPAGQFFEVSRPNKESLRVSILEESGACTVQDWGVDTADLPLPKPADFHIVTKTDILAKAAEFAYENFEA